MLALKVKELKKTQNQEQPHEEEESPENSPLPEDIMEDIDQTDVSGSESESEIDSGRIPVEAMQANVGQETLHIDREKEVLSIEKPQEQLNLDQQHVSEPEATESNFEMDYFWSQDLVTAQEQKDLEEKHHLHPQAYKAQALEQENIKLSAALDHAQSMCEHLQQKNRKLELEINNSTEHQMVTSLQEDLQREREHLTAVNEKLSDLMYKLDCKESQLVAEREKVSEEISVLKAQVNEATKCKKEFEIRLESMASDLLYVKEMNSNLEKQNTMLEQGNLELSAKLNQSEAKPYVSLQRDMKTEREEDIAVHKSSDLTHDISCKENQLVAESEEGSEEMQKEMNLNLKMLNTLLEQGNLELCAKLSHIEAKLDANAESIQYIVQVSEQTQKNKNVSDLLAELHHMVKKLIEKLEKDTQEKLVQRVQVHEAQAPALELQKSQSPLSSKEAYVHQVKEMNLELKRQNTLLEQKNVELLAELNQFRTNKNSTEERSTNLVHKCDCAQKKTRERADKSTNCQVSRRHKNVKNQATECKKEFQVRLDSMEMELSHMKEMILNLKSQNTVLEQSNLELSAKLKQQKITHLKVLDCKKKQLVAEREKAFQDKLVLQVQVHEAQASAMELRLEQQNRRLTDKENECRKIQKDLSSTQQANQKLKEELRSSFMKRDRMRQKCNESQLTFTRTLDQAKRKFNKKTEGFNSTIQTLEKEVKRLTSLLKEEKEVFRIQDEP